MKVTRPAPAAARRRISRQGLLSLTARALLALILGAAALFILLIVLRPDILQQAAVSLERRWGDDARLYDRMLAEKLSIIIGSYMREMVDGVPEIPELVIDVPFKGMAKIYAKREAAIKRGRLIQAEDDFVKAEIRAEGKTVRVKMRLKGDWNDHLAGRKWSFRIHVRDGEQLFGLRQFSIQNPNTRGFQSELMYFEALKHYGVMSPRYSFVNVTLNGEPMGLMAMEEFFTKELLERNRRREGVIVRFDESLVWDSEDGLSDEGVGWHGAFDFYNNALIDGIGTGRILESPALAQQYRVAVGLLRGFVNDQLTASEVFDAEQTGRFLAVSDMFGAWHAIAWTNMRFYLNPVTLRLEPIAYDATLQKHMQGADSIINDEPLILKIMQDPAVLAVYQEALAELAEQLESGDLVARLLEVETQHLPILQSEFRLLGNFPLDYLAPRIAALLDRFGPDSASLGEEFFLHWGPEETAYAKLAHVRLLPGHDDLPQLEISNAVPKRVAITSLYWVNDGTGEHVALPGAELPLNLPARGIGDPAVNQYFAVGQMPEGEGWHIEATARLINRPWEQKIPAYRSYPALASSPIPVSTVAEQRALHSFLELGSAADNLVIPAGTWPVTAPLVIPPGVVLTVEAGATLQFSENAVVILRGALRITGESQAPVIFEAAPGSGSWPGLVVLEADQPSVIEHWIVRDTSSVALPGWSLTGGINFYKSDVHIIKSAFLDSHGEDALNIIHSEFVIEGIEIRGTASDAFDADFSNGTVTGSRFVEIGKAGGGDAIDVSGSVIDVSDTTFLDVSDKALSVGERSAMTASNLTIESVGTGAAAKDGSTLRLANAKIRDAQFVGLTAYIKKPEYGPAEIVAENIAIEGSETGVLVQKGSRVSVDGVDAETSDVDVDALYETVMRKGFR